MDIENLPDSIKFFYISMTQSAIYFKEMGQQKDVFLSFCEEIWDSMEMTDLENLKSVLSRKIRGDIQPYVDSYMKNKSNKEGNTGQMANIIQEVIQNSPEELVFYIVMENQPQCRCVCVCCSDKGLIQIPKEGKPEPI